MATKFEKSRKDVEKKSVKEGSKKDMIMDKRQMPKGMIVIVAKPMKKK